MNTSQKLKTNRKDSVAPASDIEEGKKDKEGTRLSSVAAAIRLLKVFNEEDSNWGSAPCPVN